MILSPCSNITAAQANLVLIPKVASVTAVNATQLLVTFNKSVDKTTVISGTNTLVNGVATVERTSTDTPPSNAITTSVDLSTITGTKAKLSTDGTQLTITVGNAKFFKGDYDVSIKNVKSSDVTLANYYGKFSVTDTVGPTVQSVVYKATTDQFAVELSEPISALTGEVVNVNGVPTAFATLTTTPTSTIYIARPSTVAFGSTATIYTAGLADAAGNTMTPATNQVVVTKDESALTVTSIEQISNKVARVTFNKALNTASNAAIVAKNGLVVADKTGAATTTYTVTKVTDTTISPDGNKYDFTLNYVDYTAANSYATSITFVKDAFTDVTGNKNALIAQAITMNKDTVVPTVVSSNQSANKEAIEVVFSEELDPSTLQAGKVLLRKDGAAFDLTGATLTVKDGATIKNSILVINPAGVVALNAGTYQARFTEDAIRDINGNKLATVNAPAVTVTGTTTALNTVVTEASNVIDIDIS